MNAAVEMCVRPTKLRFGNIPDLLFLDKAGSCMLYRWYRMTSYKQHKGRKNVETLCNPPNKYVPYFYMHTTHLAHIRTPVFCKTLANERRQQWNFRASSTIAGTQIVQQLKGCLSNVNWWIAPVAYMSNYEPMFITWTNERRQRQISRLFYRCRTVDDPTVGVNTVCIT